MPDDPAPAYEGTAKKIHVIDGFFTATPVGPQPPEHEAAYYGQSPQILANDHSPGLDLVNMPGPPLPAGVAYYVGRSQAIHVFGPDPIVVPPQPPIPPCRNAFDVVEDFVRPPCPPWSTTFNDWLVTQPGNIFSSGDTTTSFVVEGGSAKIEWAGSGDPDTSVTPGFHLFGGFDMPLDFYEAGFRATVRFKYSGAKPTEGGFIRLAVTVRAVNQGPDFISGAFRSRHRGMVAMAQNIEAGGYRGVFGGVIGNLAIFDHDNPEHDVISTGLKVYNVEDFDFEPDTTYRALLDYSQSDCSAGLIGGPSIPLSAVGMTDPGYVYDIDGVPHILCTIDVDLSTQVGNEAGSFTLESIDLTSLGDVASPWCSVGAGWGTTPYTFASGAKFYWFTSGSAGSIFDLVGERGFMHVNDSGSDSRAALEAPAPYYRVIMAPDVTYQVKTSVKVVGAITDKTIATFIAGDGSCSINFDTGLVEVFRGTHGDDGYSFETISLDADVEYRLELEVSGSITTLYMNEVGASRGSALTLSASTTLPSSHPSLSIQLVGEGMAPGSGGAYDLAWGPVRVTPTDRPIAMGQAPDMKWTGVRAKVLTDPENNNDFVYAYPEFSPAFTRIDNPNSNDEWRGRAQWTSGPSIAPYCESAAEDELRSWLLWWVPVEATRMRLYLNVVSQPPANDERPGAGDIGPVTASLSVGAIAVDPVLGPGGNGEAPGNFDNVAGSVVGSLPVEYFDESRRNTMTQVDLPILGSIYEDDDVGTVRVAALSFVETSAEGPGAYSYEPDIPTYIPQVVPRVPNNLHETSSGLIGCVIPPGGERSWSGNGAYAQFFGSDSGRALSYFLVYGQGPSGYTCLPPDSLEYPCPPEPIDTFTGRNITVVWPDIGDPLGDSVPTGYPTTGAPQTSGDSASVGSGILTMVGDSADASSGASYSLDDGGAVLGFMDHDDVTVHVAFQSTGAAAADDGARVLLQVGSTVFILDRGLSGTDLRVQLTQTPNTDVQVVGSIGDSVDWADGAVWHLEVRRIRGDVTLGRFWRDAQPDWQFTIPQSAGVLEDKFIGVQGTGYDTIVFTNLTWQDNECVIVSSPIPVGGEFSEFSVTFRHQIGDPTTSLDRTVCLLESAAMVLDWQTKGAVKVWGGELVPWCGRSEAAIRANGSSLINARQAWSHWGQYLDIRAGAPWSDLIARLGEGRAAILGGEYIELRPYVCDDFTGGHAIALFPYTEGTKILVGDPLCGGFKYIEASALQAFAEAQGVAFYGSHSPQPIYFAVSQPW